MALIPAKCTECGASIKVDSDKEAGICEYCGTPFITEKVINNFNLSGNINIENATVNVPGADIDNLLARAQQYEELGDKEKQENITTECSTSTQTTRSQSQRRSSVAFTSVRR